MDPNRFRVTAGLADEVGMGVVDAEIVDGDALAVDLFVGGEDGGGAAVGFLELVAGGEFGGVDPSFAQDVDGVFGGGVEGLLDAGGGKEGDGLEVEGGADEGFFDVAE